MTLASEIRPKINGLETIIYNTLAFSCGDNNDIRFIDDDGNIGAILHAGFNSNDLRDFIKYKINDVIAETQIYSKEYNLGIADQNGNVVNDIGKPLIAGEVLYSNKYQLGIADSDGNVICDLGVINSAQTNSLIGKKLSILGDSISTYSGWIPSGYAIYYPSGNVNSVDKTWWYKLIQMSGMELCRNASWSGSRVSGVSNGTTAAAGCSTVRINDLTNPDTGDTPDIIICYISTNDWAGGIQCGAYESSYDLPTEGTINEIAPAYALMLYKLRNKYPDAAIYCTTSFEGRRANGDNTYPILNSKSEPIHKVNHAIIEIAHIFGCRIIDLETSGIHFWNISNYTTDGTLHPNDAGHTIIAKLMYKQLMNDFS